MNKISKGIKVHSLILFIIICIVMCISPTAFAEDTLEEARASLKEKIEMVTGNNAGNYYHSDDRYNGEKASSNGFWNDLQDPLNNAINVYDNTDSEIGELNVANIALTEAIGNLIPVSCINPTSLYETYQSEISISRIKSEYSISSWQRYSSSLNEAKNWIEAGLFENGSLLPVENQHYLDDVETELKNSIASLSKAAYLEQQASSKLALAGIRLYAENLFQPSRLNESDYTVESWAGFIEARNEALNYLESARTYNGMGQDEVSANEAAYAVFRRACYSLIPETENITIELAITDNYGFRKGKDSISVEYHTEQISAGTTVGEILDQAGFSPDKQYDSSTFVYLNGILLTRHSAVLDSLPGSDDYADYVLRQGDVLTVSYTRIPCYITPSGAGYNPYGFNDVTRYTRFHCISVLSSKITEGIPFEIIVTDDGALPINYTGTNTPVSGMTVYLSEACETEEDAMSAPIVSKTDFVTGQDGKTQIKVYGSGWYAVNAFNIQDADVIGDCGGLTNGDPVLIYVEATEDINSIIYDLSEQIIEEYDKYPESYFNAETWEELCDIKDAALSELRDKETAGDMYDAAQQAIKRIRNIQNNAKTDNEYGLSRFRLLLSKFPDDLYKIDETYKSTLDEMKSWYEDFTIWQSEQLTRAEIEQYEEIIDYTKDGLQDAIYYNLIFETAFDKSVDADAQDAILDMTEWLGNYEGLDDPDGQYGDRVNVPRYGKFYVDKKAGFVFRSVLFSDEPVEEIKSNTNKPTVIVDPGVTAFFAMRDGSLPTDRAWTIEDTKKYTVNGVILNVTGKMTYIINGEQYEIASITDNSGLETYYLDDHYLSVNQTQPGGTGVRCLFWESFYRFNGKTPPKDIKVTVTWRKVGAVSVESILQDLINAYNSYVKGEFTEENYAKLTDELEKGITAVKSAEDLDSAEAAKNNALASMESIEHNQSGTYGSVTVTVSNNTGEACAFYDPTEPFITETVELNDTDSMMTVILKALDDNDFTWNGDSKDYSISYLASVTRGTDTLGEFTGGPDSGWMGMLNNWFTNYGFDQYTVGNGGLKNGDKIDVVYTCDLGLDVKAGMQKNTDTTMGNIEMTNGVLSPSFDGSNTDYVFVMNEDANTSVLSFEAKYKSFQSRAYKGSYEPEADSYISSGDTISVSAGDVIYVGSGDWAWPSMTKNDNIYHTASVYKIRVIAISSPSQVIELINDISTVKYSNYTSVRGSVENARTAYDALSAEAKNEIDPSLYDKLTEAEQLIDEYAALDAFKDELSQINIDDADDEMANGLVDTYEAMTDNQKLNLTAAEKNKVEALRYEVTYEWSEDHDNCTAKAVNRYDSSDSFSETAAAKVLFAKQATCQKEGEKKVKVVFENSRFKPQTANVTVPKSGHTKGEAVIENEKEATCVAAGSYDEVVYCSVCGEELSRETVTAAAAGHAFGEPTYNWADDNSTVTAKAVCSVCGEELTETVNTTYEVINEATDIETGEGIYRSDAFESELFEVQTRKVTIPAGGHVYGDDPSWNWSDDYLSAEAVFACTTCEDKQTVEATVTSVTKEPTCTEEGETVYTATVSFGEKNYTDTKTVAIAAKGHSYEEVTVKATLTEDGYIENKCTVCGDVESKTVISHPKTFKLVKASYTYDGKAKKPAVTVKDAAGNAMAKDEDYTVKYASGRKKIGEYKVTVEMKGRYSGSKSLTFNIKPAKVKGLKLTSTKKKQLKVTYTKQKGGVKYQLAYRIKGKKTWKKVTVKGTSKLLKSLKGGKTYQVKVRAFKKVGAKTYYGAWCKVKAKKVRKA